ncbi:MAG: L-fuconate dehydratase [Lewinella sp.]|nr:L-fuconate dehydratase [Lewinella sp.]
MTPDITITGIRVEDIRFPTSREAIGSDAMNVDPDYSAAYVVLETDHPRQLEGHGLTFTIGRGNDICVAAISALEHLVVGQSMTAIIRDMAGFWRRITSDSQLRWLGPEKGVIHLATGAVVNAVWDLWAKMEGKPLWQLISEMSPEQLVSCIDFRYITDVLTPEDALAMLRELEPTKAARIAYLRDNGYPAYTTSAGWLGYPDEKIRQLAREARSQGWTHLKMKVGSNLQEDAHRAAIIKSELGAGATLMMDANQKWSVTEAIENMKVLAQYEPLWIEEPTSPDDILGHATIARAIAPIKVATGEHCQNRIIFKQLMQAGALDICQIDSCRVGGVNEVLAILLMARKFDIPVCPHAGGVGLCEYVQHLAMIDYIAISGSLDGRMIEYVDHLHEHFLDPVTIRNAAYQLPAMPGYSIEMKAASRATFRYPDGAFWAADLAGVGSGDRAAGSR